MKYDSGSAQEAAWPNPGQEQVLQVFEQSSQEVLNRRKRPGRPASVSGEHLSLGIVLCFLQGWHAQLDLWRLICTQTVGRFAPVHVCDQAIYNRLERAEGALRCLFEQASAWLQKRLGDWQDRSLAPWASEVYAVDESVLDRVGRWLPWLRELAQGNPALLAGRISAIFDVRRQQWKHVEVLPDAKTSCKENFLPLLSHLRAGALLLFDRGYFSFAILDEVSRRGFWWITRYANHATFHVSHVLYQGDGVRDAIVYLGVYRSDQAKYAVRLLEFWWHGKHYRYFTNVLDPRQLPLAQVVVLYARRWDIELAFRLVKDHINLHHFWSAKWEVVQVQLWCCLLLAQVYHALQVEIAVQEGVEVFDVSLDLLVRLVPGWLAHGISPIPHVRRFGRQLGIIRSSTRYRPHAPWIDPAWVVPPPLEAIQPRDKVRYRPSTSTSRKIISQGEG